ncbi:MAG: methionine gamma-lyase family protein, partial [Oscillospiraceae bacterium]|nr:methionine gamma-lyase family protein [Oscillospiraceae bacterium]
MRQNFGISEQIRRLSREALTDCENAFKRIDDICEENTAKVLMAFRQNRIGSVHLTGTTGYGYGDRGRDALDAVFAQVTGASDALVRHSFVSGTNAITTALFGVLRPGDTMISVSGTPYDTLHSTLGLRGEGRNWGSLRDFGITYRELALLPGGKVDLAAIPEAVRGARMAYIQRSRGYSLRPSITVDEIREIANIIRQVDKNIIVAVDNCYGEFAETLEPCDAGADLIMGSLIKNPGGGIARTGGYIAGRADLVELCVHRKNSPGVGRDAGCSLDESKNMYLGLFFAPAVVAAAMKTAAFAAAMFGRMGYEVSPKADEHRTDIIQSVILGSPGKLAAFCRGIQHAAPIDSFVTPEA